MGLVHKMRVVLAAWRTSHNTYISALHYLSYLVVARKHGVHVFELSQELPQLLRPGGAFEKVVESFTLVPEVLERYRECQVPGRS